MFQKFSKVYHNNIIKKCLKLQKICFDNIKYPVHHRRRFTWNVILSWIYDDINWREIPTSSKIAAAISYCRYDCFTIWIRYISRAITLYCNMICIYSLNLLNTIKWFWDYEILNTIFRGREFMPKYYSYLQVNYSLLIMIPFIARMFFMKYS